MQADYCHGGGRVMYSNTDECYDAGRHGSTDECYDDGVRRPAAYADDCYNGGGYGARQHHQAAVYSDEYARGGYGGEQEHYRREEREHKHKERLGEVGALAGGAFALYEGPGGRVPAAPRPRGRVVGMGSAMGRGRTAPAPPSPWFSTSLCIGSRGSGTIQIAKPKPSSLGSTSDQLQLAKISYS